MALRQGNKAAIRVGVELNEDKVPDLDAAGIAFVAGFSFRLLALFLGWEEPLAKEPKGVYIHSDGRPLLGRKLAGKSQREMRDLGLTVEPPVGELQSTP